MDFLATPARRRWLFAFLYASEGAPIGFLWWALPSVLRSYGISVVDITTLTSLLVLPWAFKVLWAPAIDLLQRRWPLPRWIVASQAFMGITLLPLLFLDLHDQFSLVFLFLILHSIGAATQDVAIDALCIRSASPGERGSLNGWMQAGMLTGRSVLGGGALIAMDWVGFSGVVLLLLAVVWGSSLLVLFTRAPSLQVSHNLVSFRGLIDTLRTGGGLRQAGYVLLFAAVSGAGYEAVGSVAGPFLIDRGMARSEVGWFFLIPAIAAMITGSLIGGYCADRIGRRVSVRAFLATMAGAVLLIGILDSILGDSNLHWHIAAMTFLYFSIGLFVSSSYAMMMDATHPSLAATQFSAYMGATNLCESWSSFATGRMHHAFGYPGAFLLMGLVSLMTLPLVKKLTSRNA
ncbi:MAG: MFS transporter [Bacteroidota bacterium]